MSATAPQRELTPEAVEAAYSRVLATVPAADAGKDAWLACFTGWNELKRWLEGTINRRRFEESQDTRNEAVRRGVELIREHVEPLIEPNEAKLREAFLAAGCRSELAEALGEQLFVRWDIAQAGYEPSNIPLSTEESKVAADYSRLIASAELTIQGETVTLMTGVARLSDLDAATRRAAWEAVVGWLEAHAEDAHLAYDRLVTLRHQMAKNLGEANFVPLAYRRLGRTEYGPAEAAVFRGEIKQHVVPVMARLRAWQAKALGTSAVAPWDAEFYPGLSLPADVVPANRQLAQAQQLFDRLDPRMAAHFRTMVDRNLIDLETRPGKGTGGYCTAFEDTAETAIFCNSTGGAQDITVLIHEMGHALQVWESYPIWPVDLRWPGMDAAEVHSMGLELLSLREIGAFFKPEDAACYRRLLFVTVLNRLPYMAVVDAFQHWIYEHPTHTHAEREAQWDALWQEFLPGIDESERRTPHRSRWMRQLHLFHHPFYYIDYALAECGALQLWQMAEQDHARAMETYMGLCRLGGTKPLVAFFESAGLWSPFTPGVLGPLMEKVAAELGI